MTIAEWRKRLLEAGFFPYTIGRDKEFYRLADEFFQAKVWKDKKLAYFVNAYLYEHSRYRSADHPHIEDGIMFEVHFF